MPTSSVPVPPVGTIVLYRLAWSGQYRPAIVVAHGDAPGELTLNVQVLPDDTSSGQPVVSRLLVKYGTELGQWCFPTDLADPATSTPESSEPSTSESSAPVPEPEAPANV